MNHHSTHTPLSIEPEKVKNFLTRKMTQYTKNIGIHTDPNSLHRAISKPLNRAHRVKIALKSKTQRISLSIKHSKK